MAQDTPPTHGCPFGHGAPASATASPRSTWWPNQLNVAVLHQHGPAGDPMDDDFDYAAAFATIDLDQLQREVEELMTTSQDWWPADWGHYGPFFVRMAWHSAGTYRTSDGRGGAGAGMQRFAPLNSWPDNVNLDKARRLLWPLKQKYGRRLSWADLIIFAGTCALEQMGVPRFGFSGGREDRWEPDMVYWGSEQEWLADERYQGDRELEEPLAAVQMGLIYVNPEGPNGDPDPVAAARDIRDTFGRMAMDDEETVALIAGGHTFGKAHGAGDADLLGPEPEAASMAEQGLGWTSRHESGKGGHTITSGLEGAWTQHPTRWDNEYLDNLFGYEWEKTKSPAGAVQWKPVGDAATVPDAHDPERRHPPMMFTTDLALRLDPAYEAIARRFQRDPEAFGDAFARAWFKLTHRDMGPKSRYVGDRVPAEDLLWQDPLPAQEHPLPDADGWKALEQAIRDSDLTISQLVSTAWASASTFRGTDKRGGANGARIRLAPQKDWAVNAGTGEVIEALDAIRQRFAADGVHVSLADLIVLGGNVAVADAAKAAGHAVDVPFTPGRVDASQEQTDIEGFAPLEPHADGFRNHLADARGLSAEELLVDRAHLLTLSAPEMTVLVGGLRVLGANVEGNRQGVFTDQVGVLSNRFFRELLAMDLVWEEGDDHGFTGRDRATGEARWTASRVDLVFGAHSVLRALAEVYACDDAEAKFVRDFAAAWAKVMDLDRFDVA